MTRQDDIAYQFLNTDRIWPPYIGCNLEHPFMKALVNVLERLPDDVYDKVEAIISFIVEDSCMTAVNVPFARSYPPAPKGLKVRFDTIVIFHSALKCAHPALVGLIAHEIAHSIISMDNHKENEAAVDSLVKQWGFENELEALNVENKPEHNT